MGCLKLTYQKEPVLKVISSKKELTSLKSKLKGRISYPFGMPLPGRQFNANSYDFGFQGQEKDDEIFNVTGSSYTAQFWQYDSRLGRRWNVDPVVNETESPYLTFSGNPIWYNDPNGDFKRKFWANVAAVFMKGTVFKDEKTGEYGIHRSAVENGEAVIRPDVYSWKGRTKPIDFELEEKKEALIEELEYQETIAEWTRLGIWDPNLTQEEARKNLINNTLGLSLISPVLKVATVTTAKNTINTVDDLINAAGKFVRLKGGVNQGVIKGSAQKIFNTLIKGAENVRGNLYKLKDGTMINLHKSTKTGVSTIDINKAGKIFKIRIE